MKMQNFNLNHPCVSCFNCVIFVIECEGRNTCNQVYYLISISQACRMQYYYSFIFSIDCRLEINSLFVLKLNTIMHANVSWFAMCLEMKTIWEDIPHISFLYSNISSTSKGTSLFLVISQNSLQIQNRLYFLCVLWQGKSSLRNVLSH